MRPGISVRPSDGLRRDLGVEIEVTHLEVVPCRPPVDRAAGGGDPKWRRGSPELHHPTRHDREAITGLAVAPADHPAGEGRHRLDMGGLCHCESRRAISSQRPAAARR